MLDFKKRIFCLISLCILTWGTAPIYSQGLSAPKPDGYPDWEYLTPQQVLDKKEELAGHLITVLGELVLIHILCEQGSRGAPCEQRCSAEIVLELNGTRIHLTGYNEKHDIHVGCYGTLCEFICHPPIVTEQRLYSGEWIRQPGFPSDSEYAYVLKLAQYLIP